MLRLVPGSPPCVYNQLICSVVRRRESAELRVNGDVQGSAARVQPHAPGRREAAHWPLVCGALATAFAAALAKEIGITAVRCSPARRMPAGQRRRCLRLRPRQPGPFVTMMWGRAARQVSAGAASGVRALC